MPIDPDLFRSVLGRFATGVTIVTARGEDSRDHGMTVSAFASLSLEPPLILVCVAHDATMAPVIETCTDFVVNILSDGQEALSRRFSSKLDDRFAGIGFTRGERDVVILDDVQAWMECRIVSRHIEGDHTIVVGAVDRAGARDAKPLLYYRGGYAQLER
jgi:flavin reductase (DIM6/NTAB) family NADH-FMN oxidoreductase RutF